MRTTAIPVDVVAQLHTALRLASAVCIVQSPGIYGRTRAAELALNAAVEVASKRK